ncbi:MAG: hypothetical protein DWQ47_16455 [Acidobacteria bacterium]|nr:MAG: hypothetical protein DWQ32_03855 [Acidobacteriota bacterium]REK02356.1 MAG: hypothetical protein DWQ38_08285 [Acidobacteriota bacterium]REK13842.1 MAG: hypothetical protein DWQ43_09545 [Acidobacteriota bacterium]REK41837.1 MAG: hypothetical protein DWQ47_16455 [Acidobacteriota bacterium]
MSYRFDLFLLILVLVAGLIWLLWPFFNRRRIEVPPEEPDQFSFEGSIDNDKTVVVTNCKRSELDSVLDEFIQLYSMQDWSTRGIDVTDTGNQFLVHFPLDLPPNIFIWLVNFIRYPIESKPIYHVFGKTVLTEDFKAINCPIEGVQAIVYCPEDDGLSVRFVTKSNECWAYEWDAVDSWKKVQNDRDFTEFGPV